MFIGKVFHHLRAALVIGCDGELCEIQVNSAAIGFNLDCILAKAGKSPIGNSVRASRLIDVWSFVLGVIDGDADCSFSRCVDMVASQFNVYKCITPLEADVHAMIYCLMYYMARNTRDAFTYLCSDSIIVKLDACFFHFACCLPINFWVR
jgi:hypothetical protein